MRIPIFPSFIPEPNPSSLPTTAACAEDLTPYPDHAAVRESNSSSHNAHRNGAARLANREVPAKRRTPALSENALQFQSNRRCSEIAAGLVSIGGQVANSKNKWRCWQSGPNSSPAAFPCKTGKFTGNSPFFGPLLNSRYAANPQIGWRLSGPQRACISKRNRELILAIRELIFPDQA